jgi:hypothetical protein
MIKHYLENIFRKFLRFVNNNNNYKKKNQYIIKKIECDSFYYRKKFISDGICKKIIINIDNLLQSKEKNQYIFWSDKENCDNRIFDFHRYCEFTKEISNNFFIHEIAKLVTGRNKYEFKVMANRLIFKKNNKGSGGGWHKDSPFSTQFKAFIYLTDVDENNGPLEIMSGSHSVKHIEDVYKKNILNINAHRFEDNMISEYNRIFSSKKTFFAKAGDLILANTKAIHRGKPILNGTRYMLTFYFADPVFKKNSFI